MFSYRDFVTSYWLVKRRNQLYWTPASVVEDSGESEKLINAYWQWTVATVAKLGQNVTNEGLADEFESRYLGIRDTPFGIVFTPKGEIPVTSPVAVTLDTISAKLDRIISKLGA